MLFQGLKLQGLEAISSTFTSNQTRKITEGGTTNGSNIIMLSLIKKIPK
jgi:hypothetical protein